MARLSFTAQRPQAMAEAPEENEKAAATAVTVAQVSAPL